MTGVTRRSLMFLLDVAVLVAAYALAFLLRFDGAIPPQMWKRLWFTGPYVVALQYAVLYVYAVPRFAWRFVGLREAARVGIAITIAAVALLLARSVAAYAHPHWVHALYAVVPGGVILIDAGLAFAGIIGMRAARRLLAERHEIQVRRRRWSFPPAVESPRRTLLIGAGAAGAAVARELVLHPDLGLEPIGFLDDDPGKLGQLVHGMRVLGSTRRLGEIAASGGVADAIITIGSVRGPDIRRIVALCDQARVRPKILPAVHELIDGKVSVSRARDVSVDDLLGRAPIDLDVELVRRFIAGRRVLVTGAGGSIGAELCRQVSRFGPARLILLDQAETGLFAVHEELGRRAIELPVDPLVGDVCDARRVEEVFALHRPDVVFHAAAHKHVPLMESNAGEAVKNNVFGTREVADAADRHGATAFVLISTDKAVNPSSIMGATKRVAEMYVQALSARSRTQFLAVRFGNVLGSTGSVIPTFRAQIAAGGPVTVTHPEMKRYFMTIPEAAQLVMQAAAIGQGGEIFVLDMGEPIRIVDLAEAVIRLSGHVPGEDIPIVFTGVRPGEKLFEEIAFDGERMNKTRHDKIWIGKLAPQSLAVVKEGLEELAAVTDRVPADRVREVLTRVIARGEAQSAREAGAPAA